METVDALATSTQHDDRFTVHNFTSATSTTGVGSAELLSTAQRLIKAASTRYRNEEWVQRKEGHAIVNISGNLYAYRAVPPRIAFESRPETELKEWGSAVEDDEVWAMSELEEFEGTDFLVVEGANNPVESQSRKSLKRPRPSDSSFIEQRGTAPDVGVGTAKRARQSEAEEGGQDAPADDSEPRPGDQLVPGLTTTKRARPSESEAEPPVQTTPEGDGQPDKQRRLDEGSLHGVIPRPHTFLTLMALISPQPTLLREYKRTIPIPLAPYTNPLPEPSQWDRRAWIIPVRGTMPWANATGAAVLEKHNDLEVDAGSPHPCVHSPTERGGGTAKDTLKPIPPAPRSMEPVFWTREALRGFWEYLKVLRVDGKLGSLGLTFHAAPKYRDGSIPSTLGQGNPFHFNRGLNQDSFSAQPPAVPSEDNEGLALSSVDYIKVYHDAVQTMLLRTAIDIWPYEARDGNGRLVEKVRVLKGAKLVLLDHLNIGVLIS